MDANEIKNRISAGLPNAEIEVRGDDGVHFEAVVVSEEFSGLNRIKRHQKVYATLGEDLGNAIHALSLKTYTPDER